MSRPSFDWHQDAVDTAIAIYVQTGVKQRVEGTKNKARPWRVMPAFVRSIKAAS